MIHRRSPFTPLLRGGTFFLVLLLLAAIAVLVFIDFNGDAAPTKPVSEKEKQEIAKFLETLRRDSVAHSYKHAGETSGEYTLFPFNPNVADSQTLCRLGFKPWQISNMLKYRQRGGRWKSAEDFRRLYGLTDADFERLRPYIRITPSRGEQAQNAHEARRDSMSSIRVEKFIEGTTIDLNTADTTLLKRIPGIGSYYAGKICRYRENLGGFISVTQIAEVEGLPENVERWFTLRDTVALKQLRVNSATFRELVRHPYLSYEQVKAIFNYRRQFGHLKSWRDLSLDTLFTENDFRRLAPYFSFE